MYDANGRSGELEACGGRELTVQWPRKRYNYSKAAQSPWAGWRFEVIDKSVGLVRVFSSFFFFQAEDGIRDLIVTGVQTCALPISCARCGRRNSRHGRRGFDLLDL